MCDEFLLEIRRWLWVLSRLSGEVTVQEAIEFRRTGRTTPHVAPELSLGAMLRWGLVRKEDRGFVKLTPLGKSWVTCAVDLNTDLLQEHKWFVAHRLFEESPELMQQCRNAIARSRIEGTDRQLLEFDAGSKIGMDLLALAVVREEVEATFILEAGFETLLLPTTRERQHSVTEQELQTRLEVRRETGRDGEEWVVKFEMRRTAREFAEYYSTVDRVSEGDVSLGYDIRTRTEPNIDERLIEVKTTASDVPHCYLSRNELETAVKHGNRYWLYILVHKVPGQDPRRVYCIQDPASVLKEKDLRPALFELTVEESALSAYNYELAD